MNSVVEPAVIVVLYPYSFRGKTSLLNSLNRLSRFFVGYCVIIMLPCWILSADAQAQAVASNLEEYEQLRARNATELIAALTPRAFRKLVPNRRLTSQLHKVMRVGDRIIFKHDGRQWLVWKRSGKITPLFRQAVKALRKRKAFEHPVPLDERAYKVKRKIEGNPVASLAFAIHAARANFPFIDLGGEYLEAKGEVITRALSDGEVTVIATGGSRLKIGKDKFVKAGKVMIAKAPASGEPLNISWRRPPARLMAVADGPPAMLYNPKETTLEPGEKIIARLIDTLPVIKLVRYTKSAVEGKVTKRVFTADHALSFLARLDHGQLGPHSAPGLYKRRWIITFYNPPGYTQRQATADYTVGPK